MLSINARDTDTLHTFGKMTLSAHPRSHSDRFTYSEYYILFVAQLHSN